MSRRFRALLAEYDLTPSQWGVLSSLWQQDGQPALRIGRHVDLLPGTLTGVLRNLEQNGWLVRQRDAEDKRVWRIWLTPEGKRLKRRLTPAVRQLIGTYFVDFTSTELQLLSSLIDRLRSNVDALFILEDSASEVP